MTIQISPSNIQKILVCQLRQIGDVVLTTPALEQLKKRFPHAQIDVYTEAKCAELLENNPNIHTILRLDKKKLTNPLKEIAFYWSVARRGYDLVVDFQQLPRIRWVVLFSGARYRLSYDAPWYNRWMYTHCTTPKQGYAAMAKASVLAPLGIDAEGVRPSIYLTPDEQQWASDTLQKLGISSDHKVVTVDPTHRRYTRRWPAEHFGQLMRMAAERDTMVRFVVLYGPGEKEVADAVAAHCPDHALVPDQLWTLRQMAAVIEAARLHVGTCSAPRHIAVATNTPSVVVLGATSQAWSFPSPDHTALSMGLDCQPCNANQCSHVSCLTNFTPDKVLPALLEKL